MGQVWKKYNKTNIAVEISLLCDLWVTAIGFPFKCGWDIKLACTKKQSISMCIITLFLIFLSTEGSTIFFKLYTAFKQKNIKRVILLTALQFVYLN